MIVRPNLWAVVLLILGTSFGLSAQPAATGRGHGLYLELGGNGGVASINYEYRPSPRLALRAGIGSWSSEDFWSENEVKIFAIPLTATYLKGKTNHKFEAGGGVLFGRREETFGADGSFSDLIGYVGYRYQRSPRGFLFRSGLTPFLSVSGGDAAYPDEGLTLSGGLSFGYAF